MGYKGQWTLGERFGGQIPPKRSFKMIDLHVHTTASDGSCNTSEVIELAKSTGLSAIAITDHDSVDGLGFYDDEIEVIDGIELSCDFSREMHIVGLYIDKNNEVLAEKLIKLAELREVRNLKTLKILNELGFPITVDEVKKIATGKIWGRAHFARLLFEKGYVESTKDAFRKYLGHGRPAYVTEDRMQPEECIRFIKNAGGIPILAHMHYLHLDEIELRALLLELKSYGLMGVETKYTEYTPENEKLYIRMAEELGLLKSGGSDFHGFMKPDIKIGTGFGNLKVPCSYLKKIKGERENAKADQ